VEDIDLVVPHQANLRIIDPLARKLGVENAVVARDIVESGNTSAASIPLALSKMLERHEIPSGGAILLFGFGGGLTYAGDSTAMWAVCWTAEAQHLGAYPLGSTDGGKSWSDPRRLGDAHAWHPDIAASPDGRRIAAVWDAHHDDGQILFSMTSNDAGQTWSARCLSPPRRSVPHPHILERRRFASSGLKPPTVVPRRGNQSSSVIA
jgi:hypothetical protein